MKNIFKVLAFGAMLGASALMAHASPMPPNGSILRICCHNTEIMTGSGPTAGLFFSNPASTKNGTGGLQSYTSVILSNTFTFAGIHPGVGELLFTSTAGGSTLQFFVTGYTSVGNILTFTGYLSFNGVAGTNATLKDIIGNYGPGGVRYYEGDLTTTPEPSSLILLGTGLAGAAGLMLRRRKVVSA